ncbi:MAG: twin-arginine translocation signal domain-containing protein [Elusimicrobiota bacterium]|jgi:hypothetical protein
MPATAEALSRRGLIKALAAGLAVLTSGLMPSLPRLARSKARVRPPEGSVKRGVTP